MKEILQTTKHEVSPFAGITFRQLEVFRLLCHERSFSNAAVEMRSTRASVKRICHDFEKAVGRKLFEETPERTLVPSDFAEGMLAQTGTLYRTLRRLNEGVRSIHETGRTLRFAAAGGFFRGGLFTDFLSKFQITGSFNSCFLRIEAKRYRSALLSAECDVYFGAALGISERLDSVDLGCIPWRILHNGKPPTKPEDLTGAKWHIVAFGEPGIADELLEEFRKAGAKGGGVISEEDAAPYISNNRELKGKILFLPDHEGKVCKGGAGEWPGYKLVAVLRRNHPYSDLKPKLIAAANGTSNGH